MRTTLDLPYDLLRRANRVAAKRGCTLRELVTQALEGELTRPTPAEPPMRSELPLLEVSGDCPVLRLQPQEFEFFEADA